MNPQSLRRHFRVSADRHRRVGLFQHAPNASMFAGGTLAFRGTLNPKSASTPFRTDDDLELNIRAISQKCSFQRYLISPEINTCRISSFAYIPLISNDFNSTRNTSSGNKDLKSIRINTSGHKDLKSFRINTYKNTVGGWVNPGFWLSLKILAAMSQGHSLPRLKLFASLGDSPLDDAIS
jgi:hypothetical protein